MHWLIRNLWAILLLLIFFCIVEANSTDSKKFAEWKFSESILHQLPIDQETKNFVRAVKNAIFSKVSPIPLERNVDLVLLSSSALENCLDIDYSDASKSNSFRAFANGNFLLNSSLSHRYGGHQFGEWASQLGDGRAHILGEYIDRKGRRWELQLKGSGRTPYSRRGDGRAVLRSSLREFLCSEAMHYLGVPTSRAVSLIVSDDPVLRDPLYNGSVISEKAAIVLRLAPSWFRFGSFEILSANNEIQLLSQLLDFIIVNHFARFVDSESSNRYATFFSTVLNQTIDLVVHWLMYGFTHGVCNTDNFSILSITIDYGPFGFVEAYDPLYVPNLSDDTGLYALERQASAAYFNLHKLFNALAPVLTSHQKRDCQEMLASFEHIYLDRLTEKFRSKLGLRDADDEDTMLVGGLLHIMKETKADFTMTFRQLSNLNQNSILSLNIPEHMWALRDLKSHKFFHSWMEAYYERLQKFPLDDAIRLQRMRSVNPRYVLRTWMAQAAIEKAEKGDYSEAWKIHMILKNPFEEQAIAEHSGFASRPPNWAKSLRVSCSS